MMCLVKSRTVSWPFQLEDPPSLGARAPVHPAAYAHLLRVGELSSRNKAANLMSKGFKSSLDNRTVVIVQ